MSAPPSTSPASTQSSETQNPFKRTVPLPPSTSSEIQTRMMKYIKHKYTTPEPRGTCVFRIPDILKEANPRAYIPQYIGLGPYHHFRPQLQVLASKKRAAIEYCFRNWRIYDDGRDELQLEEVFSRAYKKFGESEPMIRSCYDQYLDLDEETLCWIVMVDAIVLIYFVGVVVKKEKQEVDWDVEKMVPDLFKLENQVPIILIHLIRMSLSLGEDLDQEINNKSAELLIDFCRMHSPIELSLHFNFVNFLALFGMMLKGHLLSVMYLLIMMNQEAVPKLDEEEDAKKNDRLHWGRELIEKTMECAGLAGSKARELFQQLVEEFSSAVEKAENTGLKVPGNVHQVSEILGKFDKALKLQQPQQQDVTTPGDKLEIPSASRLYTILNVKFKRLPKECGIQNIQLKVPDRDGTDGYVLYLPRIKFRPYTEVILRNLVAYESAFLLGEPSDPTRLRDFVDLLCGLIRSEKDVKLLRKEGIVEEGGLSNAEIARICRGIHKSEEKPDDESSVHKTVKEANKKYNDLRSVKYGKSIMNYFAIGLKIFRAMLPFLILLFLGFQSVCEVYDCRARGNNVSSVLLSGRNDLYNLDLYMEKNPHDQAKLVMMPRKLLLPQ